MADHAKIFVMYLLSAGVVVGGGGGEGDDV